jgi:hypothetical protein
VSSDLNAWPMKFLTSTGVVQPSPKLGTGTVTGSTRCLMVTSHHSSSTGPLRRFIVRADVSALR